MDVVERNIISLWGPNKFWGILIISLFDHLYGKTKNRKIGPPSVLTEKEKVIVTWVLNMQECGLSITLQLKWKVAKVIQTQPTPFQNGLLGTHGGIGLNTNIQS